MGNGGLNVIPDVIVDVSRPDVTADVIIDVIPDVIINAIIDVMTDVTPDVIIDISPNIISYIFFHRVLFCYTKKNKKSYIKKAPTINWGLLENRNITIKTNLDNYTYFI